MNILNNMIDGLEKAHEHLLEHRFKAVLVKYGRQCVHHGDVLFQLVYKLDVYKRQGKLCPHH